MSNTESCCPMPESTPVPMPHSNEASPLKSPLSLRFWPAVAIVATYWIAAIATRPIGGFTTFVTLVGGGLLTLLLLILWWVAFSRARWFERLVIGLLAFVGIFISNAVSDHMTLGVPWTMFIAPWVATAWAVTTWLVCSVPPNRRMAILATVLTAGFALPLGVRFDGVTGAMDATPRWRWSPTAEELLLAELAARPAAPSVRASDASKPSTANVSESIDIGPGDWAEFRGPNRDGTVRGVSTLGDWSTANPPRLLWKRRIGPAWSSIAVVGDRLFTQEQRGEDELVSCYLLSDGSEVWTHAEADRFQEPAAGTGPRATPTIAAGKVFALTARGVLLCLSPIDGALEWKRDLRAETGASVPIWGFASSPLVVPLDGGENIVACITCGPDGKGVIACNAVTGEPRWRVGTGHHTYASCHLVMLDKQPHIISVTDEGLEAFAPEDGRLLWEHRWPLSGLARMLQPQVVGDDRILVHSYLDGAELIRIAHTGTD